jgi:hypothetical protein
MECTNCFVSFHAWRHVLVPCVLNLFAYVRAYRCKYLTVADIFDSKKPDKRVTVGP